MEKWLEVEFLDKFLDDRIIEKMEAFEAGKSFAETKLKEKALASTMCREEVFITESLLVSEGWQANRQRPNANGKGLQEPVEYLLRSYLCRKRNVFVSSSCVFAVKDPV